MKTITGDARRLLLLGAAILVTTVVVVALLLSGWLDSGDDGREGLNAEAVARTPRLAIDMDPSGNTYDDATNSMALGQIDYCLETGSPGNDQAHTHAVHVVITGVEDLVGWQARLNYEGGQMRPLSVNFAPFADSERGQNVSFLNLPLDPASGVHREVVGASILQPMGEGSQTSLIGATYSGQQTFEVSPDTPAKSEPDDSSYSAPGGGVLAEIRLQVGADRAGQGLLFLDVDDGLPNGPGSTAVIFSSDGTEDIDGLELELGDGFHGEGAPCLVAGAIPTVNTTPTPLPPLIIRGREILLVPGMNYKEVSGPWCSPGCSESTKGWYVVYDPDPDPQDREDSSLVFDEDFNLLQNEILAEDRDLFEPILDALDPPYDPFASPPAYIFIKGKQVPLAPGMTYGQGITVCDPGPCAFPGPTWDVTYDSNPAEPRYSRLSFDDNYNLLGTQILPEDQDEFQPLLDAFAAP